MKLTHQHRQDILKLLQRESFREDQFDFIKKRGRINVVHAESQQRISYLRKKLTKLHPIDHNWTTVESFRVKINKSPEFEVDNWSEVVHHMRDWLGGL